jgi:hypothetical protein
MGSRKAVRKFSGRENSGITAGREKENKDAQWVQFCGKGEMLKGKGSLSHKGPYLLPLQISHTMRGCFLIFNFDVF